MARKVSGGVGGPRGCRSPLANAAASGRACSGNLTAGRRQAVPTLDRSVGAIDRRRRWRLEAEAFDAVGSNNGPSFPFVDTPSRLCGQEPSNYGYDR